MRFKLRSVGNSVGIIFPTALLKKHNLHIGDNLIGNDSVNSITLTVAKTVKKYSLHDLVAQSYKLTDDNLLYLATLTENVTIN